MAQATNTFTPTYSAQQLADMQTWVDMNRDKIERLIKSRREFKAIGRNNPAWQFSTLMEWLRSWKKARRTLKAALEIVAAENAAQVEKSNLPAVFGNVAFPVAADAPNEQKAVPVFTTIPKGCALQLVRDNRNAPHILQGDYVIIDRSDTVPELGELFAWRAKSGQCREHISQLNCQRILSNGEHRLCYRLDPLDRPRSLEDAAEWILDRRQIYASEGPIRMECIGDFLTGRVIGIYEDADLRGDLSYLSYVVDGDVA